VHDISRAVHLSHSAYLKYAEVYKLGDTNDIRRIVLGMRSFERIRMCHRNKMMGSTVAIICWGDGCTVIIFV
jgi:hypothetical protein